VLTDAHSTPADRLQRLTILQRSNSPELKDYLAALQKNSLTNAAEVYGVSTWMVGHGLVDDALAWVSGCPAKLRAEQPVPLALVDCYLAKKDWRGLDSSLQEQKWGELEFLRLAFLSRSAAELNQKLAADSRWRTAIRLAGDRLGPLTALMTMATTWGRDQAREDLLWQIAQHFPKERWALRELERLYSAAGNTHGLNRVYAAVTSYSPNSFVAQNNLAATSLLLKLNLSKAHALAKEVFTQHPKEAIVASTYAYSLHLQGRTKEGLGVLEKLSPDALATPSVALYYGLLLSASGETNKAAKYLDIAQKADLLPEEKALAAEAAKLSGPRS
jgi:predicted Zn-dependent protease